MSKDWNKIKQGDDVSLTVEGKVISMIKPYHFYRGGVRFLAHNITLESKGKYIYFNLEVEANE